MPKIITREQLNKLNEKMSNGWNFYEKWYYFCYGEKSAVKRIHIDEKSSLEAQLCYREQYDWESHTTNIKLTLHISKFYRDTTYGLGVFVTISENLPKKMFSLIQKETANWTDEKIIALAKRHDVLLDDSTLFDKNGAHLHEV